MWRDWKSLLGVVLVFVLGGAAGVLTSSVFYNHRETILLQRGTPAFMDLVERRLSRGLHLDAEQQTQVHGLLVDNLERRKHLQAQIQPQVQELNIEMIHQIRSILHPDQIEAFRKNLQEMHRRFGGGGAAIRAFDQTAPQTNAAPVTPAAGT